MTAHRVPCTVVRDAMAYVHTCPLCDTEYRFDSIYVPPTAAERVIMVRHLHAPSLVDVEEKSLDRLCRQWGGVTPHM